MTTSATHYTPATSETPQESVLERLWAHRNLRWTVAVSVVAAVALISAWLTPRGPGTTTAALVTVAACLAMGIVIGFVTASRWSLLVGSFVYILVFELARLSSVGPTVDAPEFGSMYGILALVLGRGVHGLLAVVPMLLGAVIGIWLSGRFGSGHRQRLGLGWVMGTLAMAVVLVYLVLPASTAPIMGPDGHALPDGVAELTSLTIGGHDQAMMIRGRSVDSPVLLYLAGGPGGTDVGAMRADVGLEEDFVVVTWDQRGAGKSYAALDPVATFTLQQMVADTIELTEALRARFDEERIYLVGQSWGSTLGALTAAERPDLYHAFVGVGQMVSQRRTDIMFWEDTLAWAESTGDAALAATLEANGPPPYDQIGQYAPVVSTEHSWNHYPELNLDNEMPAILFVPEYTWMDRINAFRGFLDTNATLYPQLQGLDFAVDLTELEVPYYMVEGEHEARGRAVPADDWFNLLDAPTKERFLFEGAGHRAHFDRPAEFSALMREVLADTYPG